MSSSQFCLIVFNNNGVQGILKAFLSAHLSFEVFLFWGMHGFPIDNQPADKK